MITVSFSGTDKALIEKFQTARERIVASLREEMFIQTGMLKRYIAEMKLSGQVLRNRTGNLRRAVFNTVEADELGVTGMVAVDKTAPYGAYQEFGADIPERVPVRAKAMHWVNAAGQDVFARRARAFHLGAKPFMNPSLEERRTEIVNGLKNAVQRELAK